MGMDDIEDQANEIAALGWVDADALLDSYGLPVEPDPSRLLLEWPDVNAYVLAVLARSDPAQLGRLDRLRRLFEPHELQTRWLRYNDEIRSLDRYPTPRSSLRRTSVLEGLLREGVWYFALSIFILVVGGILNAAIGSIVTVDEAQAWIRSDFDVVEDPALEAIGRSVQGLLFALLCTGLTIALLWSLVSSRVWKWAATAVGGILTSVTLDTLVSASPDWAGLWVLLLLAEFGVFGALMLGPVLLAAVPFIWLFQPRPRRWIFARIGLGLLVAWTLLSSQRDERVEFVADWPGDRAIAVVFAALLAWGSLAAAWHALSDIYRWQAQRDYWAFRVAQLRPDRRVLARLRVELVDPEFSAEPTPETYVPQAGSLGLALSSASYSRWEWVTLEGLRHAGATFEKAVEAAVDNTFNVPIERRDLDDGMVLFKGHTPEAQRLKPIVALFPEYWFDECDERGLLISVPSRMSVFVHVVARFSEWGLDDEALHDLVGGPAESAAAAFAIDANPISPKLLWWRDGSFEVVSNGDGTTVLSTELLAALRGNDRFDEPGSQCSSA